MSVTRYRAACAGEVVDVDVHADGTVIVDGASYAVEALPDGRYLVTDAAGARVVVTAAGEARSPWVGANGVAVEMSLQAPTPGRAAAASTPAADMTSPMPATVVSIAAAPGAAVQAGEPVIVVEAMKMTLTIRAPRHGVVRAVYCRVGELVKAGAPLAELEP